MSNIRQQKWDWPSHVAKMIELYHNVHMSIPDIHKAIQSDGFEPCQRSVYLKFKSMGYPTDPIGRTKLLEARLFSNSQAGSEGIFNTWSNNQSSNFYTNEYIGSRLCPLPEGHMPVGSSSNWKHDGHMGTQAFEYTAINSSIQFREEEMKPEVSFHHGSGNNATGIQTSKPNFDSGIPPASWPPAPGSACFPSLGTSATGFDTTFNDPYQFLDSPMELNGAAYFGIDTGGYEAPTTLPGAPSEPSFPNANSEIRTVPSVSRSYTPSVSSMGAGRDSISFDDDSIETSQRKIGANNVKIPFQSLINASSATSTRNRLRSLFRPKSSSSSRSKKRYATSQFTNGTDDSGYASGFAASSLTLDMIRDLHSQSLNEFNGLYRVACHILHEPQGKAQCKDVQTCTYCRYSGIHNLGWSARYLKLEVFLSELKLLDVYDFGALDAAGNTALHYAAAGGAGYQHLKALIDVGVDPYLANTAGELFIYCLRPLQPFTLEPNSDCLKGDDLLNLLALLKPERVFGWRDNDGHTIMHALALKIRDQDLRAKIFKLFIDAGYSPKVPDRWGRTAEDLVPFTYDSHGQVIDHNLTESFQPVMIPEEAENVDEVMTCEAMIVDEWRLERVEQIKSQTVVVEARHRPNYIDPETGDNVVHALSKLDASNDVLLNLKHFSSSDIDLNLYKREGNYILLNLEYFIQRGVDLNLHNRDGNHPIKSFICNRPREESDETGATMSKYLDAILWGDLKERIRNKINVNMKDREGATALHSAAIRGRPDSVRSLIEAGANVNARSDNELSVLQATLNALDEAVKRNNGVLVHLIKEVISHLEHAGAVQDPPPLQERGIGMVR